MIKDLSFICQVLQAEGLPSTLNVYSQQFKTGSSLQGFLKKTTAILYQVTTFTSNTANYVLKMLSEGTLSEYQIMFNNNILYHPIIQCMVPPIHH